MYATAHVTYYNPFRDQNIAIDIRIYLGDVLTESDGDVVQHITDYAAIPYEWALTNLTIHGDLAPLTEGDRYV